MNVVDLIRNPKKVDELLADLNEVARSHSSYEYGLPMYEESTLAQMREVVYRWATPDPTNAGQEP